MSKTKQTVGQAIDGLWRQREKVRKADIKLSELKTLFQEMETELKAEFSDAQIDSARGQRATASISRKVVPAIEDWGKLRTWILRNKAIDMLQKRVSTGAWRERVEATGRGIPGVDAFTKVTINLRTRT